MNYLPPTASLPSCAHLTVKYKTITIGSDGATQGWWECIACKREFKPLTGVGIDSITEYALLANVTLADRVRKSEMLITLNAATGISSEAGEINEIVKKRYFHEHPHTPETVDHMEKELGDLVWYWALMCYAYNLAPSHVLSVNIAKLKKRYPDGFSTERSMNRAPEDI